MSYDAEFEPTFKKGRGVKEPLLHKRPVNVASSLEIQETLNNVTKNIGSLKNYSARLGKGTMSSQERSSMNRILNDTCMAFKKCSDLLENYKKSDADMYHRKFKGVKEQLEEVMEEIKQGEKVEIEKAK